MKEFDQFRSFVEPTRSGATTPSTSVGDLPTEMDLERDRRRAHETEAPPPGETPNKFAKSEGKGEPRTEEDPRGKGKAQEPRAEQLVKNQTGSGQQGRSSWTRGSAGQHFSQWQGRRGDDKPDRGQDRSRESKELRELKEAVRTMGRMLLRVDDQLSILGLDHDFVLFLQTPASGNEFSIVDKLYAAAKEWKDKKEADPSSLTQPLRNLLLFCLFAALKAQLQRMETEVDLVEKAQKMGLVENQTYLFLQWDGKQRKHVKAAQPPLEHKEAVEMLGTLEQLTASANVVGRFHANRKLTSQMSSDIVPFSLTIQNRTQESHSMFRLLHRLSRNSMWHLVGATLRPSKLGRGPAAQALDKILMYL